MIRKHENSVSWKAGALAIAVHVVLVGALLISFNWKAVHSVLNLTEVDLWDKLPAQNVPKPEPKEDPVIKEEPKPDPKVEEKQKIEEQQKLEEQQAEIALEKKKKELAEKERQMKDKEKLLEEKHKKDEEKKKLLASMREEDLVNKEDDKKQKEALKKLQQDALNDEKGESDKKASTENASLISKYIAKISDKIRSKLIKTSCVGDSLELRFEIGLLPSGELAGNPTLNKSSGIPACDDAVERAIIASQPLPLPPDQSLFSSFRNLNLKFRPNDN
jgi:colicin import membrane protein